MTLATAFRFAIVTLVVLGFSAAPVAAQQDRVPSAEKAHMWWNDNAYIVRLKLNGELRGRLDEVWERHGGPIAALRPGKLRSEFHQALRKGQFDTANAALAAWADAEKRLVTLQGELRIGVLSLLDDSQRQAYLEAAGSNLAAQWSPRLRWPIKARPFSDPDR